MKNLSLSESAFEEFFFMSGFRDKNLVNRLRIVHENFDHEFSGTQKASFQTPVQKTNLQAPILPAGF